MTHMIQIHISSVQFFARKVQLSFLCCSAQKDDTELALSVEQHVNY